MVTFAESSLTARPDYLSCPRLADAVAFLAQRNLALLASCPEVPGCTGGLYSFDGGEVLCIDRLSTTGLCVTENNLFRLTWADNDMAVPPKLFGYDARGVLCYARLDVLREPHDIVWNGKEFIVVSTAANCILGIAPTGKITSQWQLPGSGDAWHLNSLLLKDGQVLVSAFGRFQSHREWHDRQAGGAGIVFDLATGRDVLTNLSFPHHPRFIDNAWVVCNSGTGELLQLDPTTSAIQRRLQLGGWTRGVAVADQVLFVGVSTRRRCIFPGEIASIAVVCRKTWDILGRIPVPCREVYDLLLVPCELLQGLRRGLSCSRARMEPDTPLEFVGKAESADLESIVATRPPLAAEECRVKVEACVPPVLATNADISMGCAVENLGQQILMSAPPYPVHLSYKWIDALTGQWIQEWNSCRTPLPANLGARETLYCKVRLIAPPRPGRYVLRVTAVQEGVAWFDDLHTSNFIAAETSVVASSGTD
jgi:acetolactate synthase-1/2/3 large subunit